MCICKPHPPKNNLPQIPPPIPTKTPTLHIPSVYPLHPSNSPSSKLPPLQASRHQEGYRRANPWKGQIRILLEPRKPSFKVPRSWPADAGHMKSRNLKRRVGRELVRVRIVLVSIPRLPCGLLSISDIGGGCIASEGNDFLRRRGVEVW
jgi:hypothetical protein